MKREATLCYRCSPFIIQLILFHHTWLLLCCLICCLWMRRFCLFTNRLCHSHIWCHRLFTLLPLLLFGYISRVASATLMDRRCFHRDESFSLGHMRVIPYVDSEVGVEWLQLFGKELVCQRVESIRAPVEPGPFQKIKPRVTNIKTQNIKGNLVICFLALSSTRRLMAISNLLCKFKVKARKQLSNNTGGRGKLDIHPDSTSSSVSFRGVGWHI